LEPSTKTSLRAEIITAPIFIALPLILAGVGLTATLGRKRQDSGSCELPGMPEPLEEAA